MNKILETWTDDWFGFWRNDCQLELPVPEDCVCSERPFDFDKILEYLGKNHLAGFGAGATLKCRLCSEELRWGYQFDGQLVWPFSLTHYIKSHSVGIPTRFVERIRKIDYIVPTSTDYKIATGKTRITKDDLPLPRVPGRSGEVL